MISLSFKFPNESGNLLVAFVESRSPLENSIATDSIGNSWMQNGRPRRWKWQFKWPFLFRVYQSYYYTLNRRSGLNTVKIIGSNEISLTIGEATLENGKEKMVQREELNEGD